MGSGGLLEMAMWGWLRHWHQRLKWRAFDLFRRAPRLRALWHSYQKGESLVPRAPIPLDADSIFIEAMVEWYGEQVCLETGFELHIPQRIYLRPAALKLQAMGIYHMRFCLPPFRSLRSAVLYWHENLVGFLELPFAHGGEMSADIIASSDNRDSEMVEALRERGVRARWQSAPAATFTSEGGFRCRESETWTQLDDLELEERLGHLASS